MEIPDYIKREFHKMQNMEIPNRDKEREYLLKKAEEEETSLKFGKCKDCGHVHELEAKEETSLKDPKCEYCEGTHAPELACREYVDMKETIEHDS